MTRLFTGDYSTGDFSQWNSAISKYYSATGSQNPPKGSYLAQVIDLGDCGYAARFEVRPGDEAIGETGNERSVLYSATSAVAALAPPAGMRSRRSSMNRGPNRLNSGG